MVSCSRPAATVGGIELEARKDVGHLDRMDQVGLAREARLPLVGLGREDIGAPEQVDIRVGIVALYALYDVFETNCRHSVQAPNSNHQISNKLHIRAV